MKPTEQQVIKTRKEIGAFIKEVRISKGITTPYKMRQVSGVEPHILKNVEEGTASVTIDTIIKLLLSLDYKIFPFRVDGEKVFTPVLKPEEEEIPASEIPEEVV